MPRRTAVGWFPEGLRSVASAISIQQVIVKARQASTLSWIIGVATRTHLQAFPIRKVLPVSTLDQLALIIVIKRVIGHALGAVSPGIGSETVGWHGETTISNVDLASRAVLLGQHAAKAVEV